MIKKPTLSDHDKRNVLSAKKKKKVVLKNLLVQPFERYWWVIFVNIWHCLCRNAGLWSLIFDFLCPLFCGEEQQQHSLLSTSTSFTLCYRWNKLYLYVCGAWNRFHIHRPSQSSHPHPSSKKISLIIGVLMNSINF